MIQNMAMIDEGACNVWVAKIHANSDTRIRPGAGPWGDDNRIHEIRIGNHLTINGCHQEVELMYVERVRFAGLIRNRPVFHRPYPGDDRRWVVGVEEPRRLSGYRDVELTRTIGPNIRLREVQ